MTNASLSSRSKGRVHRPATLALAHSAKRPRPLAKTPSAACILEDYSTAASFEFTAMFALCSQAEKQETVHERFPDIGWSHCSDETHAATVRASEHTVMAKAWLRRDRFQQHGSHLNSKRPFKRGMVRCKAFAGDLSKLCESSASKKVVMQAKETCIHQPLLGIKKPFDGPEEDPFQGRGRLQWRLLRKP